MVVVDREKCTGCGSCVQICHQHCVSLVEQKVAIERVLCSTCTQCVAMCAQKALSWDGASPVSFEPALLPSAAQLDELFRERRTIRDFADRQVDRAALEEIVSYGACAPTHNFDFRSVIIDDPALISLFGEAAFRFSRRIYRLVFRPRLIRLLVLLAPRPVREEFRKAESKLRTVIGRGKGFATLPPDMVCIVGDRRIPLSLESAQYVLYTMALYAQVKGLACRNLVGNQMIFNANSKIRRGLGLQKHERIFAVAGFGHPAVRFRNKVMGKKMPGAVEWGFDRLRLPWCPRAGLTRGHGSCIRNRRNAFRR